MLDGNKDALKLEAMKRIIGVSISGPSIGGKFSRGQDQYGCCPKLKFLLSNYLFEF